MKALLTLLLIISAPAMADIGSVDGIFNKALETKEITRQQARSLYLLKDRTLRQAPVSVFRMPLRDSLHAEFVRDILAMSPQAFDKEWQKLVNAGLAPQIEEARNPADMLLLVSKSKGGIGYLSHNYLVLNGSGDAVIVRITD